MKTAEQLHAVTLKRGLKPIPKLTVTEWADKYRVISTGNAEPGRWKTSRVPYMRAVMDAFTEPGVERIVVKSAAQVGKSSVLENVIGRFAHVDPASILIVMPTLELAQDFSKSRLSRLIDDTKVLTPLFYGTKKVSSTRDPNQTILSKFYAGGRIVLAGANSPSGLASRPIRILLCDEVDRFPPSAGDEGDPVNLAARRTTTFWNRKIGLFSTPTTEGESRIDLEYLTGTQEEWRHRCPNCGEYHQLLHVDMMVESAEVKDASGNVRELVRDVRWKCPDCGVMHDELALKKSLQRYVAQNPDALRSGIRSFFISGYSSPWLSWRDIEQEWAEAKGKPEIEKVVYNTRFGTSYRVIGAFEDEVQFLRRLESYEADIPDGVLLLTCAVDVQENRLEYEVCGWGRDEECWGVERSVIYIAPTSEAAWEALDAVINRDWYYANGEALKVSRVFVDSGYLSTVVYRYCRSRQPRVMAIKGIGGVGKKLLHKASILPNGNILMLLGVNEGKEIVFARLTIDEVGAQYFHYPMDVRGRRRGYDQNYFKQLISEQRVMQRSGGISYGVWEKTSSTARNESLDLRVYNLAAVWSLQRGRTWEDIAASKEPAEVKAAPRVRAASVTRSRVVDVWS